MSGRAVGRLIVRLNAVTSQFRREMTEAQAKLQKTARVAEDASQTIATALAAVGVGAAMAGGAAIKMAAQWEQTEIAFETMLKSGEKARSFLAELENFADKTPFEMPGLINSTRRLMAFGFEAEEIIPMLTAVGNATAALGGGDFEIYRMTYALGQMRAKGTLAAEEMSRQLGQIIPAWEFLAESIGVSVAEAKKMAEQGMIPATEGIQAILQGMTREYGDAMGRQNRTLIGQWSTLKDRMRTIVRGMGAYFIDTLDIMPILQRLNRAFEGLATALRGVENPAEAMRAILQQAFTPERRLIVVGLAGAISGLLYPALAAAATAAWKAAIALAPFVAKGAVLAIVIYNLYDALTRSTSMMDKAAAVTVALGVAALFAYSSGLVALVRGLWAATTAKWAMIAAAKTLWGKIVALFALMGPKGWLMIAGAIGVTVAAVSILNRALAQTTAILAGAPQMQDYADGATEGQKALTEALEESTKAARRNILSFDQVHTLQEEMGKTAGGSLPGLPDFALPTGMGDFRTALVETEEQMNALASSFEQATPPVGTLARAWEGLKAIAGTVTARLKSAWEDAKTRLGEAWATLRTWASERLGAVKQSVNDLTDSVPSLRTAFENAKTFLGEQWSALKTWAGERLGAARQAIIDLRDSNPSLRAAFETTKTFLGERWATLRTWASERLGAARQSVNDLRDANPGLRAAFETTKTTLGAQWATLRTWGVERWGAVTTAINTARDSNPSLRTAFENTRVSLVKAWAGLSTSAETQWTNIRNSAVNRVNEIIGAINNLIAAYNRIPLAPNLPMIGTIARSAPAGGGMGGLRQAVADAEQQIGGLTEALEKVSAPAQGALARVRELIEARFGEGNFGEILRSGMLGPLGVVVIRAYDAGVAIRDFLAENEKNIPSIATLWGGLKASAGTAWTGITNAIAMAIENARIEIGTRWDTIISRLTERWRNISTTRWTDITTAIAVAVDNARIEIGTRWDEIISRLRARWAAIQGAASIDWEAINENIRLKVLDLSGWLGRRWAAIQSALGTVWTSIQGAAGEQWATIRDNVVNRVNEIIGAINSLIAAYNRIPLAPNLPMIGTISTGASAPAGGGMGGLRTAERSTANQARINQLQADIARVSAGVGNPATEAWFARQHGGIQHYLDSQRKKLQDARLTPFAKGGIVTSPTRALIGEAGPEAVIPLRRGTSGLDAIADAVGNAVLFAMREAMRDRGRDQQQEVVLEVDGKRLGRVMLDSLRSEEQRTGMELVVV